MPAGRLNRLISVALFLVVVAAAAVAHADEPQDVLLEYPAAVAETTDANESQAADNVFSAANMVCDVTPRDAVSPSGPTFYGTGTGTHEATVNRVTSHAADNGAFTAHCVRLPETTGGSAAPFTMALTYNFQYKIGPSTWEKTGDDIVCQVNSQTVGQNQVAAVSIPGRDCGFERIYLENDPSIGYNHRAEIHLATNVTGGPDILGWSLPWSVFRLNSDG
jgi:hypothetical protein